ncbi:putative 2-C-methyl-D-erythritol 2,4-cyclodiphosphate synthase [Babesia divergens]|uniref:2-C-methyl-D-erythritol 2,4-cyclodiphosphate synthase n=1 Tax=Babesia divergens TaxID=32595 RepID=A0AAD9LG36_BABDI|nr:putative 2-C-methyl-D-erythritol 2,4-cyclodiphosphate synthase [Babesia divergens]
MLVALFVISIFIDNYVNGGVFFTFCFRLGHSKGGISRHRLPHYYASTVTEPNLPLADKVVGLGYDIHRLVDAGAGGKPLKLGGVNLEDSGVYVLGHSDGDAVLHAISDSVLGAVGLGDIGEYFSDLDPGNHGLASSRILQFALSEARNRGYRPCNVDVNIILQRPRLGADCKQRIRSSVCEMMGRGVCVNVKAKTNEGLDSIGAGNAVACQSIVLLERVE